MATAMFTCRPITLEKWNTIQEIVVGWNINASVHQALMYFILSKLVKQNLPKLMLEEFNMEQRGDPHPMEKHALAVETKRAG